MATDNDTFLSDDDSIGADEEESSNDDKTSEKNEKPDDEKPAKKSQDYQKKHWRERAKELEKENEALKNKDKGDDKEKAALNYLRSAFEGFMTEREAKALKAKEEFEESVQDVLSKNPTMDEDELLDVVERFKVDPQTAAKILNRYSAEEKKREKPRMPKPKQAPSEEAKDKDKERETDKGKSLFQIAQEEAKKAKERLGL